MSTKGRDTSMKEKIRRPPVLPRKVVGQQETRGRSLTLPGKASIGQQENRGKSPTLTRKAGIGQQETRGRSPSLPRKIEIGQRGRSLTPSSILERKRTSTSLESKKVPTVPWPSATMSPRPSARNPKKQVSPPKTKPLRRPTPPSKVMSTKLKSNPKNITSSSLKTSGSMKPKGSVTSRSPLKLKNSLNVKETKASSKRQQTKNGLELMAIEKNPVVSDTLSSSQNDHNMVNHEEHDRVLHGEVKFEYHGISLVEDQDIPESEISCEDDVSFDGSVENKHAYDHNDGHVNQQDDQSEETTDIVNNHLDHSIADQENQEPENEEVEHEAGVGSTNEDIEETKLEELEDVEEAESEDPVHEVTKPEEPENEENKLEEPDELEEADIEEEEEERKPEMKEDDVEVPEEEDTTPKVVIKSPEVVMHGKKDSATYNDVIEETVSKLREQRKNRVLALAGAFETVISLESDVSPKDLSPKNI